jgi:hypothetical protein
LPRAETITINQPNNTIATAITTIITATITTTFHLSCESFVAVAVAMPVRA